VEGREREREGGGTRGKVREGKGKERKGKRGRYPLSDFLATPTEVTARKCDECMSLKQY